MEGKIKKTIVHDINVDRPIDVCKFIVDSLEAGHNLLCDCYRKNPVLWLQKSELLTFALDIVDDLKEIEEFFDNNNAELSNLDCALRLNHSTLMMNDIVDNIKNKFEQTLTQFGSESNNRNWVEPSHIKIISHYMPNGFDEERLAELNNKSLSSRRETYEVLSSIRDALMGLLNEGKNIILKVTAENKVLINLLQQKQLEYSRAHYSETLGEIQFEMQKLKSYTFGRESEAWFEMWCQEKNTLMRASDNSLRAIRKSQKSARGYSAEEIVQLHKHFELMNHIGYKANSGKLFGIRSFETYDHTCLVLPGLTPDSIDLFNKVLLRINIINCEISPKLKEKFLEWMNLDDTTNNESASPENYTDNILDLFLQPGVIEKYLRKMVEAFYRGKPLPLALIYCVLNDYTQLKCIGDYQLFVKALIDWRMLPTMSDSQIKTLAAGISANMRDRNDHGKIRPGLTPDFRNWKPGKNRSLCEAMASMFGDQDDNNNPAGTIHYKFKKK